MGEFGVAVPGPGAAGLTAALAAADAGAGVGLCEFGRGGSAYDGYAGDRYHCPGKAPILAPLDQSPYYAVGQHTNPLGAKGGPRVDTRSAVLDADDEATPASARRGTRWPTPPGWPMAEPAATSARRRSSAI